MPLFTWFSHLSLRGCSHINPSMESFVEYSNTHCFAGKIIITEILLSISRRWIRVLFALICFAASTLLISAKIKTWPLGSWAQLGSVRKNFGNWCISFVMERWLGTLQGLPVERTMAVLACSFLRYRVFTYRSIFWNYWNTKHRDWLWIWLGNWAILSHRLFPTMVLQEGVSESTSSGNYLLWNLFKIRYVADKLADYHYAILRLLPKCKKLELVVESGWSSNSILYMWSPNLFIQWSCLLLEVYLFLFGLVQKIVSFNFRYRMRASRTIVMTMMATKNF